ncbi:unnamed protein product [Tetraodon nigroviridis]|uniref:(spotted green pufferfish) hypothetical protein n=1 Tax=Tetraodon nigroviridis TaxID=99883 RepID=Q4SS86_TETNG|nr:unnamed protein product [Tetraodon nigroviridis]
MPHGRLSRLGLRPAKTSAKIKHLKRTSLQRKIRNPSPTEMSVEPWAGTRDQAAAEDTHSTSEASSQDLEQHPDKLCLDSFWSEVETIQQGCVYPEPDCTRRDSRQSEEGEQEEQWLADAGLSNLISEDSEDADRAVLLSTLTRTQAEAVQRRLDSYTLSLRKRNKPAPRDVRDIFNSPIAQVSWKPLSKENTPCTQGQLLGGQYHSLAVCNLLINVLSQTLLPGSQQSEDLAQDSMASVAKAPLSTPKEEYLITDVAYCEQAVIFLKQAKLERDAGQRRKEDGTLPVRTDGSDQYAFPHLSVPSNPLSSFHPFSFPALHLPQVSSGSDPHPGPLPR